MSNQDLNPFVNNMPAETVQVNALQEAESQRAIQEVQAAMVIAKKFPRDQRAAMDRILNACTRPTLAQTALYSYPRGGQEVTGPSIRLAEAMAQEWGNMQFGVRELSAQNGVSTVEAYAWDVETNTRQVKVFQVPHQRYTRAAGLTILTDPRDIYELIANNGARRLRSCILGIIPGDVTEAAVNQCGITQHANIDVSPETIKSMVEAFENEFKVTGELIQERLGKRIEAINPSQMLSLKKIFQSMRDGMSKPQDWFNITVTDQQAPKKESDLNDQLKPQQEQAPSVADTIKTAIVEEELIHVGKETVNTDQQEPHGGAVVNVVELESGVVPAAEEDTRPWPREDNGFWHDSAGAIYDERKDGWSGSNERPAVNSDGTFRAKRGTGPPAKKVPGEMPSDPPEQQQQQESENPAPGNEGPVYSETFNACIEGLMTCQTPTGFINFAKYVEEHKADLKEGEFDIILSRTEGRKEFLKNDQTG